MIVNGIELNKLTDTLFEIPKQGGMRVPGRIYISEQMIRNYLSNDESLKQVMNVAHLPGIEKYSIAMPDIHWGYGFPIGGVAAMNLDEGVISPGGVGYDINCGVRLAKTNLEFNQIKGSVSKLIEQLFKSIPTGVGASGAIKKLSKDELKRIALNGSRWAVEKGFGSDDDLSNTEEGGCLNTASADAISSRAFERGADQAGTLGSGNHFLELGVVSDIYDEKAAEAFGLFKNQITVFIHTGSRGFGHQICDDFLKILINAANKYKVELPDKQLACAPISSPEGQDYIASMSAAANFAWNNRQIIMHLAKNAMLKTLHMKESDLGFSLLYDVCHNIAKIEEHTIDGMKKKVCVHRKGATRAYPKGHQLTPAKYRHIGQPVLIPGDMGRYSYVCAGTEKAMEETFGSSCHGAGRTQSRNKAMKAGKGRNLIAELKSRGVVIQAHGKRTIAEEMPYAYKDVRDVVDVMHDAGITTKVAKLKPIGVIKG